MRPHSFLLAGCPSVLFASGSPSTCTVRGRARISSEKQKQKVIKIKQKKTKDDAPGFLQRGKIKSEKGREPGGLAALYDEAWRRFLNLRDSNNLLSGLWNIACETRWGSCTMSACEQKKGEDVQWCLLLLALLGYPYPVQALQHLLC